MAFAVVSSLLQTLYDNDDRFPISVYGKLRIASMRDKLQSFEEFLQEFPKEGSKLERRMRDAVDEGRDILENFIYDQLRLRFKASRVAVAGIAKPISNCKECDFDGLKWVMKEIDSINREMMAIKIGGLGLVDFPVPVSLPLSRSLVSDNIVVGFDDHVLRIKGLLCGESSGLQVIPITGMGGIGKTTLASLVYNDPMIQQYFDIRVWVTVSQDYKNENIVSNLVDCLKGFEKKSEGVNEDKVYKRLFGRRYLIVLDDVWSTEVWDDLKRLFPDCDYGSRIMLTTRMSDVASHAKSSIPTYELHLLNQDESWSLLSQKVFKCRNISLEFGEEVAGELEMIGREIARSCRGLPLAIVLIAGVLSTISKMKTSWKKIADDVNSAVNQSGQIEEVISLSYTHLPHHLRPCFLYMGGFPEDYEIHVSKLIKLWIAEGFVKPSSSKSFEVAAEENLEDLVKRSLAFVKRRKSNGQIKSCHIHDLVRDFCKRKALEENYQCHFSIAHSDLKHLAKVYGSTIRSVVCFEPSETSLDCLCKFRLLRVIDVVDTNSNSI